MLSRTIDAPNGTVLVNESGFLDHWRGGEKLLHERNPGGKSQWRIETDAKDVRFLDEFVDDVEPVGLESKVGQQAYGSRIKAELRKDCTLLREGKLGKYEWHFFGSHTPGGRFRLGPTGPLLDELIRLGSDPDCPNFSFVIHVPTSAVVLAP